MKADKTLTVVATIVSFPGAEDKVRNALLKLIEPTRKEAGFFARA
jgi:quinol monooxygenase YgiN